MDLKKVCRTCLQHNVPLMPIFKISEVPNSEITKHTILDLLELFTGISVSPNDGLSDNICSDCVDILHQSYNFKLKWLKSENISKQLTDDRNHVMDSTNSTIKYEHCTAMQLTDDYEILNEEEDILEHGITEQHISYVQEVKQEQEIQISTEAADFNETNSHRKRVINDLQCSVCMKIFKNKQNIRNHMIIHTNGLPYKCEICSKTFRYKKELTEHVRIDHPDHITILNNLNSKSSSKIFSEKSDPIKQTKRDDADRPFQCEICLRTFVRRDNLTRHHETYHSNKVNSFKCPICSKVFSKNSEFVVHYRSHSAGKPFKCEICEESFQYTCYLLKHMETIHSGETTNNTNKDVSLVQDIKPEQEIKIDMKKGELNETDPKVVVYSTKRELVEHMKNNTKDLPFKCKFCAKKFLHKLNLATHKRIAHSDEKFNCTKCSRSFLYKSQLQGHMKKHTERRSFQCEVCSIKFKFLRHLKNHQQIKHANRTMNSELIQPMCSKLVANKISLDPKGVKPLQCEVCSKNFRFDKNLKKHLETVHADRAVNTKQFKCTKCSKLFKYKQRFNEHMKTHNDDKPVQNELANDDGTMDSNFKCKICSRLFVRKSTFNTHMRIHRDEKPFKCEICSRNFRLKRILKSHMENMHSDRTVNSKKFKCATCSKLFQHKFQLNAHMKVHSDEKPFQCEFCSHKFRVKCNLKSHMQVIHAVGTMDSKYECTTCSRFFENQNSLNVHMRLHTGERPFKCELCPKNYRFNNNLIYHMKNVHADGTNTNAKKL